MAARDFPELGANALVVLQHRYLVRGEDGKVAETPDQLFHRVARNVASANDLYHDGRSAKAEAAEFYAAMRRLDFLPNSPTLMNAGTEIQQLAACFVIPVGDSIEAIYDAVKYAAVIHQSGGGTGFSFSQLRPAGDVVRSTMGIASGPVSFMRVFDAATEAIKQGGRRRGASMGILRVDHPDIEAFIHLKDDLRSMTNFNISVAATDSFIAKAKAREEYDLVNPRTGKKVGKRDASSILDQICSSAWRTGDPGMVFLDAINRSNPTPGMGEIESTNPCGEVPLLPFEACNLGSINLDHMLVEGSEIQVDWNRLAMTVDLGIRFLDNVIDVSKYPLPQITAIVHGNRKVGLGVMGFADMLVKLGIRYGSQDSLDMAERLIVFVRKHAEATSSRIAKDRGDFPNIGKSIRKSPSRNATVLSIAPTGSISMIAGCSSGIEPLYALSYVKHVMEGSHLREVHPYFLEIAKRRGFYDDQLNEILARSHSIAGYESIPADVRQIFVTSFDVPIEEQVSMQAAFQRHVDNAVSKTINLPAESAVEQVRSVYLLAHSSGCKGITIYREGSRPGQVLTAARYQAPCPDCGSSMRYEEGVFICPACGYATS
ncbi:MAG TPA: adenosylcobalamin-dependent ribonucleoside-diphosphate reductase [Methanomassiliicoccales archaeon]|nr:adenosylcobalamin-dependent ribonucleoside-diphosphate reductase [Methanomassiliicoccales archaeon]